MLGHREMQQLLRHSQICMSYPMLTIIIINRSIDQGPPTHTQKRPCLRKPGQVCEGFTDS